MVNVETLVRPALPKDQQEIANLMFFESRVHRHLDWRTPLDWLGSPFFWVLEQNGKIVAALACPQEQPEIAWIRLFTHTRQFASQDAWRVLWEIAREEIKLHGEITVAAICLHHWFEPILQDSGFINARQVISMEWQETTSIPIARLPQLTLRAMQDDDLVQVAVVDAAAFEPIWQNSLSILKQAYPQALIATVAETAQGMVGYQISTKSPFGAHLARLAVHPQAQRQGIASALIHDLTMRLEKRKIDQLTVNPQSDNTASQALYRKNGFIDTDEAYPVYTLDIPAKE
ncbi:MAG: GNAT family N-acetyltransferase [Anaerolineales bacterium]|nr:GNAT family N-acetyltransferase [Anaerolineales bacterium]